MGEKNMKRLLLALDLDGTLLNSELKITSETQKALEEFKNRGHLVTIATGRPLLGTQGFARELDIDIPLILHNGARIADAHGQTSKFYPIDGAKSLELLDFCRLHNLPCSYFIDDDIYMLWDDPLAAKAHEIHDLTTPKIATNPDNQVAGGVTNFTIIVESWKIEAIYPLLRAEFDQRLQVARSGSHFIDIFNAEVSKGRALQDLAKDLGIEQKDVIAVGDNHNDLSMLKYAGFGVAMAGADSLVKDAADYVTLGNDEDGIAAVVEKLLQ